MTENTGQNVTQFSLGEELPPLNVSVSASEEMEEEPVSKKPKVDDDVRNPDPSPNIESSSQNETSVPSKTDGDELDAESKVGACGDGESSVAEGSDLSDHEGKSVKKEKRRKRKKVKEDVRTESDEGGSDADKKLSDGGAKARKKKGKSSHLRKNIREIITTDQLDEQTVAAQREEQERRARMTAKLQQQQQQNLLDMLNAGTSSSPFGSHHHIDKLLASKGVSPAQSDGKSISSASQHYLNRTIIDEVTLSSDEDQPDVIPFDGVGMKDGINCYMRKGFNACGGFLKVTDSPVDIELKETTMEMVESDSDDCVVLSPSQYHDELDKEGKDDDSYVPDELGRVLVNVAHPAEDADVFLAPQIARAVKPHQISGIRFLYDNVVESLERFNTSNGFGCILAHSMGLGKTIQAISFCDVFLRHTRAKKVLIIVPINTIQNWVNEFDMWIPPDDLNACTASRLERKMKIKGLKKFKNSKADAEEQSNEQLVSAASPSDPSPLPSLEEETASFANSDTGSTVSENDVRPRNFQVYILGETVKTLSAREKIITEWHVKGGVLLVGYEMFRMLALKRLKRSSKKKQSMTTSVPDGIHNQRVEEESLDRIYEYLVKPGPDLVICDEGHRIKNSGASISQALKAIGTRRRVVLTGYPLQNNLMEYWCMVDFVRPNYLGSKTEFSNMFERPITNGHCVDSSTDDKKLMRYRSHVLHTLLEGFVQRRSHVVLQSALPFKEEWVFLLKMTPVQYTLYKEFISYLKEEHRDKNSDRDGSPTANPIKAFAVCCKIWNHPDALYNVVKKKEDVLRDLDLDDLDGPDEGPKKGRKPRKSFAPKTSVPPISPALDSYNGFSPDLYGLGIASMANIPATVAQVNSNASDGRSIKLEWATPVFKNYEAEVLENGVKFQLLFALVEETQKVGDRLLVFSQSLLTLDLIELFLGKKFQWKKNVHYFRLDGSTSALEREKLISDFNGTDNVHLFLVSTRAGSLGINLIGANRVVVFDASWNPCHDAQAVCRVYRYGQKKQCQIYRFVTDCSLEKRIYDRQINKRGMADRVVDEMNPETHLNTKDVSSFLVLDHAQMEEAQKQDITHKFNMSKFTDPVIRNVLFRCGNRLTREPFEHESLLIDRKETKLSAKEKRQARQNYEMEKKQASTPGFGTGYSYTRPSYAAYYPKPSNSNVPLLPSSLNCPSFNTSESRNSVQAYPKIGIGGHRMMDHRMQPQHRELPYNMLKERGIDCRFMILKKDAYLQDPSGGPEIFLNAGDKINIFRSSQGTYIRAANGRFIAIKPTGNSNVFRGVPLTGDVSAEQLQSLVYSLLKPAAHKKTFSNPYISMHSGNSSTEIGGWPAYGNSDWIKPPPTQKLPPTSGIFPKFQNHQFSNLKGIVGGDVSVLKKSSMKQQPFEKHSKNGSGSGSDIEIIEFDEHFGENSLQLGDPKVKNGSLMPDAVTATPKLSRRFAETRSATKTSCTLPDPPVPEMSITAIPPKNNFMSLTSEDQLESQLHNFSHLVNNSKATAQTNDSGTTSNESSRSWEFSSANGRSSTAAEEALDFLLKNCNEVDKPEQNGADMPVPVGGPNLAREAAAWSASDLSAPFSEGGCHSNSIYNPSLALQNLLQNLGHTGGMNTGAGYSGTGNNYGCKSSSDFSANSDFRRFFNAGSDSSQRNKTDLVAGSGSIYDRLDIPSTSLNNSLQSINLMPGQYYGNNNANDLRSSENSSNYANMFQ